MPSLSELRPQPLWNIFQSICEIPHPSGKEAAMTAFVKSYGENLGLETILDSVGNVVIRKPATPGKENSPGIILQSHLDMVPQKNNEIDFDFEKDAVRPYVDGEWVTAEDTTLGADNGIGMAAMLALLAAKDIKHGPIEALFTVNEEVGMTGAHALKPDVLQGSILINLDSETEGEIYIGCAGGLGTDVMIPYREEAVPNEVDAYEIVVKGLKGGHSGADIHLGRGNANKILNRILWHAAKEDGLLLASIHAGGLFNAIPREAKAVVVVPKAQQQSFMTTVQTLTETIQQELATTEPKLNIICHSTNLPSRVIDQEAQENLFDAVYACPHGVMGMSADVPGLVETSTNLSSVISKDGTITIQSLSRSAVDSLTESTAEMIDGVAGLIKNAKIKHFDSFPGWKPNIHSAILKVVQSVYEKLYKAALTITAIHAGLECALFVKTYPHLDMVSLGPTIIDPHSPDERVNIATVERFWDFLVEILKTV